MPQSLVLCVKLTLHSRAEAHSRSYHLGKPLLSQYTISLAPRDFSGRTASVIIHQASLLECLTPVFSFDGQLCEHRSPFHVMQHLLQLQRTHRIYCAAGLHPSMGWQSLWPMTAQSLRLAGRAPSAGVSVSLLPLRLQHLQE